MACVLKKRRDEGERCWRTAHTNRSSGRVHRVLEAAGLEEPLDVGNLRRHGRGGGAERDEAEVGGAFQRRGEGVVVWSRCGHDGFADERREWKVRGLEWMRLLSNIVAVLYPRAWRQKCNISRANPTLDKVDNH